MESYRFGHGVAVGARVCSQCGAVHRSHREAILKHGVSGGSTPPAVVPPAGDPPAPTPTPAPAGPAVQTSSDKKWTPDYLKSFVTDLTKQTAGETAAAVYEEHRKKGMLLEAGGFGEQIARAIAKQDHNPKHEFGRDEKRGLVMARAWFLHGTTKGDRNWALNIAKEQVMANGGEAADPVGAEVIKALSAGGAPGSGSAFIPPNFVAETIELLRNVAVVRGLGARTISLKNGSVTIPKHTASASFQYVGENQSILASQPSTGNITLNARKGRIMVPVSNDFRRYSGVDADAFVRDDIVQSVRLGEDLAFYRGSGSQYMPKGIRNWALSANQIPMTGGPDLAKVTTDLGKLILALEEANVSFTRVAWIFAPRTRHYLMTLRDGLGNFAFRPEMLTGTLWGYPWRSTNQVPKNLGNGGNESEVVIVDMNDVLIGDVHDLEVEASTEASYKDAAGNMQSTFDLDQMALRGIVRHDLGVRHEESIAVLTGVTWGA